MENENFNTLCENDFSKLTKNDMIYMHQNNCSLEELEQYKDEQKRIKKRLANKKYTQTEKGQSAVKKAMQKLNYNKKEKLDKLCERFTSNEYLLKHLLDQLVVEKRITIIENT